MPSYAPDLELLRSARRYVSDIHQGVTKRAAQGLNIDYIMLRRFLVAGRAKPENRQLLRNALDAKEWGVSKDHKVTDGVPIDVTRSVLTQLLDALDALQASSSQPGREGMDA